MVRNTQQLLAGHKNAAGLTPQYAAYFGLSWLGLVALFMIGLFLQFLTRFRFTRKLLLRYPRLFTFGIFSHAGPSEKQMRSASFGMDFLGKGYSTAELAAAGKAPDVAVHTRVTMPDAYYATVRTAVDCLQFSLLAR